MAEARALSYAETAPENDSTVRATPPRDDVTG